LQMASLGKNIKMILILIVMQTSKVKNNQTT